MIMTDIMIEIITEITNGIDYMTMIDTTDQIDMNQETTEDGIDQIDYQIQELMITIFIQVGDGDLNGGIKAGEKEDPIGQADILINLAGGTIILRKAQIMMTSLLLTIDHTDGDIILVKEILTGENLIILYMQRNMHLMTCMLPELLLNGDHQEKLKDQLMIKDYDQYDKYFSFKIYDFIKFIYFKRICYFHNYYLI